MAGDGRRPVIVGAGQVVQRLDEGEGREPVELLVDALRAAEADAGVPTGRLTASVDSIRVVQILSWRYRDPGARVAERLGARPRHTLYTGPGGHLPQVLLGRAAGDIQAGRCDVVVLGGAETWHSRTRARAAGHHRSWPRQSDTDGPTELVEPDVSYSHPAELARGVLLPIHHYPLFESALRTTAGRSPGDHERHVAELWSRFSAVAAANPHAWTQTAFTADELLQTSSDNRMVALPYRKRMCANNQVDMAAGIVMCSESAATAAGVIRDRWVYPIAMTTANDTPFVSERADLASSPAIRAAGQRALDLADCSTDDIVHIDMYSCFPSAVEIAAQELGLSLTEDRPLTVTGGLSFAGGPWNNYVSHALAAMTDRLRHHPGERGLVTGLGGFSTKHSIGIYSTSPPADGFRWEAVAADAPVRRPADDAYRGPATLEAWTVVYDRAGRPETGIVSCLTGDGHRAWGTTSRADDLVALTTEDLARAPVRLDRGQLGL
jgi:acetyl-CoA C-acetyltransferase